MTIALRGVGASCNGTTSVTITQPTSPSSPQTNDILVAFIIDHDAATNAQGGCATGWLGCGWTYTAGRRLQVFTAIVGKNGLTGTSWSFTGLTTRSQGMIICYSGVDTTGYGQLDVVVSKRSNASGTTGTLSITTVTAGCELIGAFATINASVTWSNETTVTEGALAERFDAVNSTYCSLAIADKLQAAAGVVGNSSATMSTAGINEGILLALRPLPAAQTISSAGAIATGEAFGTPKLNLKITPSGIVTGEAFGTPTVTLPQFISNAGAITSLEAFGTNLLILHLLPSGIVTSEAFGTSKLIIYLSPSGIDTTEGFGTTKLILYLLPSGIASEEIFGNATVISGAQFLQPSSIASEETFGTMQVNLIVAPSAITAAEAFGTANIAIEQFLAPDGITSAEAFGDAQLNLFLVASGIPSAEAFGILLLEIYLIVTGISSGEVFGAPQLNFAIAPGSVPSAEAFGGLQLNLFVIPIGISSEEAFGNPIVNATLFPDGIVSAETLGAPYLTLYLAPGSISSQESFGVPNLGGLTQTISNVGEIASQEVVGNPSIIIIDLSKQLSEVLKMFGLHWPYGQRVVICISGSNVDFKPSGNKILVIRSETHSQVC